MYTWNGLTPSWVQWLKTFNAPFCKASVGAA